MQKTCPKCEGELAIVERGAYKCASCGGMSVPAPLVPFVGEAESAAEGESRDAQGGRCPFDRSILTRAEIEGIHLERCPSCRGIWFDRGEWAMLAERQLLQNLDQIWTAEWRARQRRMQNERSYEARLREEFGPELYAALTALAAQLKGHERRSQAMAFLEEASDE